MAGWKSLAHLEDHFGWHHRELRVRSIAEYDANAQETIALGVRFTYIGFSTQLRRIGYYHRETARFVVTDLDGFIHTHFQTDEGHVADLDFSTYTDEYASGAAMQTDTTSDKQRAGPSSDREMLDEARRRLVRIHASVVERTNSEVADIMPWTLEQLMGLIREIREYEREHPAAS